MAEQTAAAEQGEVERLREEVLRLRDLLISRDAELGALRGRVAEMEAQSQRLLGAARRVYTKLPGSSRAVDAAMRRLGRRG